MGNLWAFILLIGPLIFVHELGHLLAAKLVDVKVIRFSIGFGPALLRVRFGETEYCLAPIPLGGYVSMLGQGGADDIPAADQDRALSNKPLWARYLVLGAGPLANLLLPILVYFFFFLQHTTLTPAVIGTVLHGSAADQAGLVQGDRIVAIDGHDIRSWKEMTKTVSEAPGVDLEIQVERDGKRLDRTITPTKKMNRNALGVATPVGRLGVMTGFYAPQIGIIDVQSPAYLEGLRTGDTITSINGEPVRTVEELQRMLEGTGGALVRLTFLRATPVASPLGTLLWYESAHAQLLPGKDGGGTGILPANNFVRSVEPGSPAAHAGMRARATACCPSTARRRLSGSCSPIRSGSDARSRCSSRSRARARRRARSRCSSRPARGATSTSRTASSYGSAPIRSRSCTPRSRSRSAAASPTHWARRSKRPARSSR
ncbi:MAG: site-2 protease family protein [Deltaproteobacteria bacterium]|nr:site-2 protease family protein [Deltaproteobacteria bacterium]